MCILYLEHILLWISHIWRVWDFCIGQYRSWKRLYHGFKKWHSRRYLQPLHAIRSLVGAVKLFTSNWKLNPHGWDSNPAKTQYTYFQNLMRLRFLMSHHRKNSVRDKVIGEKWTYSDLGRSTLHTQSVGHHRGWVWLRNVGWLVFVGWVISYASEWRVIPTIFEKG